MKALKLSTPGYHSKKLSRIKMSHEVSYVAGHEQASWTLFQCINDIVMWMCEVQ
jgi:hypothetical protein